MQKANVTSDYHTYVSHKPKAKNREKKNNKKTKILKTIFFVTKIVEMPFRLQVFLSVPMYKNVELKSSFLHNTLAGHNTIADWLGSGVNF